MGRRLHPGVEAGERAGEAGDFIRDYRSEATVLFQVLVGVDDDLVDLRREALDRPLRHRLAAQELQALVDAAHAAPLAAGEDDPGDAIAVRPGHGADSRALLAGADVQRRDTRGVGRRGLVAAHET